MAIIAYYIDSEGKAILDYTTLNVVENIYNIILGNDDRR